MTTDFEAWSTRCADVLSAYAEALWTQKENGPDAQLIVMANYGDLCASLLKPHDTIISEIARLQAQLDSEQEHLRDTMQRNVALQAQVVELADAADMYMRWANNGLIKDPGMLAIEAAFNAALAKVGR